MPAYTIEPLVTAIAINTGGRNGRSETTDHSVSVNVSVRKEIGHGNPACKVDGRGCRSCGARNNKKDQN
jgi:hypothetical protein